jgi:protein-S-isoprenylcysteine O-methyltransferase Ste14
MWPALAVVFHLLSRLAYVVGVGVALRQQDHHQVFTRKYGVAAGFQRFKRLASPVMVSDAISFVLLCIVTRDSLHSGVARAVIIAAGGVLIVVGIGTKLWARASLGADAYYWHNFFDPGDPAPCKPTGPYRFLQNPMYTVGYLQMYGLALALGSLPGLLLAGFAQAAILVFHQLVELPHYRQLMARGRG